jgi:hypothetical protein
MVNMRHAYKILMGNVELKGPFGRHMRRWEVNIIMDLKELGMRI